MRRLTVVLLLTSAVDLLAQTADYQRAEQFLTWNALRHVTGDEVNPNWYRDSTRFWYRVNTARGPEFMTVNAVTGTRSPLFDQVRLAAAITLAADTAVAASKLPFTTFAFENEGRDERRVRIRIGTRAVSCDIGTYTCAKADTLPDRGRFVRSPDERWDAFVAGYNLWVRPVAGGDSIQLTTDGTSDWRYGSESPTPSQIRLKLPNPPRVYWSPDSKRLVVARIDERNVGRFHLFSSTTVRPTYYSYPYALPGDTAVQMLDLYHVDVGTRTSRRLEAPPQPMMSLYSFGGKMAQWSPGSERFYFTHQSRGPKLVQLMVSDGVAPPRRVIADSSKTYVVASIDITNGATNWRPMRNGDVVWFSERDGWGHLYHVAGDGTIKRQLTAGDWVVTALVGVDETAGRVVFTARGREANRHPEYDLLYSVALDGTGLTMLSPEDADHAILPVPGGRGFLDTYSRVDQAPVTVLRGVDGRIVKELERADITALRATGWRPGEVFRARARDGVTEITGVIWKPSHFDSTKRYPVIDHIYPGPLITPYRRSFSPPVPCSPTRPWVRCRRSPNWDSSSCRSTR